MPHPKNRADAPYPNEHEVLDLLGLTGDDAVADAMEEVLANASAAGMTAEDLATLARTYQREGIPPTRH